MLIKDDPTPQPNGPVLSLSKIIIFVIASAAEVKLSISSGEETVYYEFNYFE